MKDLSFEFHKALRNCAHSISDMACHKQNQLSHTHASRDQIRHHDENTSQHFVVSNTSWCCCTHP